MKRRDVLKSALAGAAALAAPSIVRAEAQSTLTFVPHADLASLDPVWTTADITRNFSLAVSLAWHALGGEEFERAAADRLLNLLAGIGLGQPLGHDRAIDLRQRIGQQRERLFQANADDLVGRRTDLVDAGDQRGAHR